MPKACKKFFDDVFKIFNLFYCFFTHIDVFMVYPKNSEIFLKCDDVTTVQHGNIKYHIEICLITC